MHVLVALMPMKELSTLEELNRLRSPIEFTDLLGERIGYVDGDKSCVYSSNPNMLHYVYCKHDNGRRGV